METLVFQLASERCAVCLEEVDEVIFAVAHRLLPGAPDVVLGLINVRGRVVTLVDPRRRLGLSCRDPEIADHFILCRTPTRLLAMFVDRALEIVHIPTSSLESAQRLAPHAPLVTGVATLPDGLLLIYSLHRFLSPLEEEALDAALSSIPETDARSPS